MILEGVVLVITTLVTASFVVLVLLLRANVVANSAYRNIHL